MAVQIGRLAPGAQLEETRRELTGRLGYFQRICGASIQQIYEIKARIKAIDAELAARDGAAKGQET